MLGYVAKAHPRTHSGAQNGNGDSPNNPLPTPIPAACQRAQRHHGRQEPHRQGQWDSHHHEAQGAAAGVSLM